MKSILLGLTMSLALSGVAHAATSLRIPVVIVGEHEEPVNLKKINSALKAKGADQIPSYYEVSTDDQEPYKKSENISDLVDKANQILGTSIMRNYSSVPGDSDTEQNKTCYRGTPSEVIGLVQSLGDSQYSDQLGIHAWKYKKETHYVNASEEDEEFLLEGSMTWREWRGNGEAILILSAIGDGGDDVQESLIKRCK